LSHALIGGKVKCRLANVDEFAKRACVVFQSIY
jgi:hypothetical protein